MKIPSTAIIAEDKLTRYLLVPRAKDDKAKFLAKAGFTLANADMLLSAILRLIDEGEAAEDGVNEYGTFYRVDGVLVNDALPDSTKRSLQVTTVWVYTEADDSFRFVTLKPKR